MIERSPAPDPGGPALPTDQTEEAATHNDGLLLGVVLIACPEELDVAVTPMVRSVTYQASMDATLGDALIVFGPQRLSRLSRWKLFAGPPDSRRVRGAFQSQLPSVEVQQATHVALGLIIVDSDVASVESRLLRLQSSPDMLGLPMNVRGISLTAGSSATTPANVTAIDTAVGPVRLDNLLMQTCRSILEEAESMPNVTVPGRLLADMIGTVEIVKSSGNDVTPAPLSDEEEAATHATLLARSQRTVAPRSPQADTPVVAQDRYTIEEGLPLRLTYLVVALSAESRPKHLRHRIVQLVVELDHALTPGQGTFASRTWLVAAGQGETKDPLMKTTGQINADDLWRPTTDFLDVPKTMEQMARLMAENIASYNRRSQPLIRPLVLFIMPSASMPGARTQSHYRKIKDVADVGWLITEQQAPIPRTEVDAEVVVTDKDDVINELLYAVGYPLLAGSRTNAHHETDSPLDS